MGKGVRGSYAQHTLSRRVEDAEELNTQEKRGGVLGGEESDPSPLRPGHAHAFRLPSRAPVESQQATEQRWAWAGNGRGCSTG